MVREHSDDPLAKWEHWVDRAISDAQERGEFDDLPGHGKPLQLDDDAYAGEWALGFRVLKNAEMAPLWMELDREINALRAEMHTIVEQATRQEQAVPGTLGATAEPMEAPPRTPWLRWRRHRDDESKRAPSRQQDQVTDAMSRSGARQAYVKLAETLDEKIRLYNLALPLDLQHLQRARLPRQEAEKAFDSAALDSDPKNRKPSQRE
jgi:hypothetical protein